MIELLTNRSFPLEKRSRFHISWPFTLHVILDRGDREEKRAKKILHLN